MEIWKDIIGYEGCYKISNTGKVKSIERKCKCGIATRRVAERILSPFKNSCGYSCVILFKENGQKAVRISRLVGIHFISNPFNLREVNHISGDKTDNSVYNLEWVTRSENVRHAYRTGLNPGRLGWQNKK